MCQKAIYKEDEENRKEETTVEIVGTSARKRLKNKTHYQGNSRRYRQGQMSVIIVGGTTATGLACLIKNVSLKVFFFR